ncbi:phosphate ABC transporter permease PstA [Natronorubrum sp. FCH18a]|uniref:phosphate ABC transporter permease PstA n=1 Tax=Natronorubrum sp. FCH18a TaxID=3447018 RepID=UPI003F50DB8E
MAGRTTASTTGDWFGAGENVGRTRGKLFEWTCLGATLLALGLMLVFLLYVANDALQPLTADPAWMALFGLVVTGPIVAFAAYVYRTAPQAGRVAYTALGIPLVTALAAGGVWIVYAHIVTPHEWLALVISLLVAAAVIEGHTRVRPDVVLERLAVVVLVPLLTVVGIPGISVDVPVRTPLLGQELFHVAFSIPELVPSVRGVILSLPVLPTAGLTLLGTFAIPIAAAIGWHIRRVRKSDRDGAVAFGATVVLAGLGLALAPVIGVTPMTWIVFAPIVVGGCGLYAEHVLRHGDGAIGLAFPVVVAVGFALLWGLAGALGVAGPDAWLDWSFLTSPHSTDPTEAGIYPALIGSILILAVIVVTTFPIGVGAAIYLEEYAPTQGRMSKVVELLEINVANLAGVPSVVYGVLGLAIFIRTIGMGSGTSLVAGFTIGLLILPIVIISAQEAIRAVPDSRRNAAYGMGATKWQTVRSVVLPEAIPGILTGTILALGRAIGETAPLLMIGVAAVVRTSPNSFTGRTGAMSRQIYTWSTQIGVDFRYGVLAAGVVTLLVVLMTMNATAIVLRNRYQRTQNR